MRPAPPFLHSAPATRLCALLLIAGGLAAYAGSLGGPFLFDDLRMIVQNPRIRALGMPLELLSGTARPLAYATLAVNYFIGGLDPRGYHLANVLIHLAAGVVLFDLLRRTLQLPACGFGASRACWLACAAAGLWLVHPLHTQSVTYTIQRMESLMGLLYLSTLHAVVCGATTTTDAPRHRPRTWCAVAVLCCAAGMATKEVMVTAPLVALWYDRLFLAGSFREVWRRRGRLHLCLLSTWIVLAGLLCFNVDWSQTRSAGFALPNFTLQRYLMTQPAVVVHYLGLALWPRALCLDYLWTPATSWEEVRQPLIVLAGLGGLTAWALLARPRLGFLGACFILFLAPSSSLVPLADAAMEHRMYLPLGALITAAVLGIDALFRGRWAGRAGGAACALVVAALAWQTHERNSDYQSRAAMWTDVTIQRPQNPRGHYNLGNALFAEGRLQAAVHHYLRALQLNAAQATVCLQLGRVHVELDAMPQALNWYEAACQLDPRSAESLVEFGTLLADLGRHDRAETLYRAALRHHPEDHAALTNLGVCLYEQQHYETARAHLELAVALRPDISMIHTNLGRTLFALGRIPEAAERYQQALQLADHDHRAHRHLAEILQLAGRREEAMSHLQRALDLEPASGPAHQQLAILLAEAGRAAEAGAHREAAQRCAEAEARWTMPGPSTVPGASRHDQRSRSFVDD